MVKIKPFKAIRPAEEYANDIASLPYDVLSTNEARKIGRQNEKSFLHIDKSEIDLAEENSPYAEEVYQKAASNLKEFLSKKWLVQDDEDQFYLYQLTMNGRSQMGLVVCASIKDYQEKKIKKHEFTREEKEVDRIRHIDAADANTSPIFLTYRDQESIDELIEQWVTENEPMYDFSSFHEVKHKVWVIDQKTVINQLEKLFEQNVAELYIADGHHRTESAVKVALKRKETYPNEPDEAEFNYFLAVLFPASQLAILDYNRVVNGLIEEDFLDQLAEKFEIEKVSASYKPDRPKTIGMYLQGDWYKLTIKPAFISNHPVKGLDVSLLQEHVLTPLFGIKDIRTDKRVDFIGGIRGMQALSDAVDKGSFTVAFSMYPTKIDELIRVADSGEVLPPKSTWFEPKLLSGLFVHDLESK
ncbi:DUF1015 domain-containing protein [Carnobacterium pleistocenium]|uniref:DUF1015 domain-containing protein n=1 Tax=Carnobacterium pleistocenium TaxID=181073 RepID=UPI00054FE23F|nr:DUF1015 family protein [Carnobacterium pleistocenium]